MLCETTFRKLQILWHSCVHLCNWVSGSFHCIVDEKSVKYSFVANNRQRTKGVIRSDFRTISYTTILFVYLFEAGEYFYHIINQSDIAEHCITIALISMIKVEVSMREIRFGQSKKWFSTQSEKSNEDIPCEFLTSIDHHIGAA